MVYQRDRAAAAVQRVHPAPPCLLSPSESLRTAQASRIHQGSPRTSLSAPFSRHGILPMLIASRPQTRLICEVQSETVLCVGDVEAAQLYLPRWLKRGKSTPQTIILGVASRGRYSVAFGTPYRSALPAGRKWAKSETFAHGLIDLGAVASFVRRQRHHRIIDRGINRRLVINGLVRRRR